jgi:hypothetical protein
MLPMPAVCCLSAVSAVCLCTEMNYEAATDDEPAGEVLLRGPQLFSGYYKQVGVRLRVCPCVSDGLCSAPVSQFAH